MASAIDVALSYPPLFTFATACHGDQSAPAVDVVISYLTLQNVSTTSIHHSFFVIQLPFNFRSSSFSYLLISLSP